MRADLRQEQYNVSATLAELRAIIEAHGFVYEATLDGRFIRAESSASTASGVVVFSETIPANLPAVLAWLGY